MRIRVTRPLGAGNARYRGPASLAACGAAAADFPGVLKKRPLFHSYLNGGPGLASQAVGDVYLPCVVLNF
jgi:hypothetical protein